MSSKKLPDWETFRRNLFLIIKHSGLTQKDFAQRIGANRTTVNQWLRGSKTPNTEQVFAIAEYYGSAFDSLFGRVPADLTPLLEVKHHLRKILDPLAKLLPDEWSESDLRDWTEYKAKGASATRRARNGEEKGERSSKNNPIRKKKRR